MRYFKCPIRTESFSSVQSEKMMELVFKPGLAEAKAQIPSSSDVEGCRVKALYQPTPLCAPLLRFRFFGPVVSWPPL